MRHGKEVGLDDRKIQVPINLQGSVIAQLDAVATQQGTSRSRVVREAIGVYLSDAARNLPQQGRAMSAGRE